MHRRRTEETEMAYLAYPFVIAFLAFGGMLQFA